MSAIGPAHAVLSPSSAERWISCPASVRVGQEIEARYGREGESSYAREGTAAHALGELRARYEINEELSEMGYWDQFHAWEKEFEDVLDVFIIAEMQRHIDAYVQLLRDRLERHPMSHLLLEQRVVNGVPTSWGTSDAIIVSPYHVEAIDLKYGAGVWVDAWDNPQLKLYGVGALENFADLLGDIKTVYMTIFQPRIGEGTPSTFEMPAADLRAWRDSIIPIANEALGPDAHFGPNEDACRWCPAAGHCRAQVEFFARRDFDMQPDTLSGDEIGDLMLELPAIEKWCEKVRAVALDLAYSKETPIAHHKVVLSHGQRYVTDEAEAARILLEDKGFEETQVWKPRKFIGIGELEKLLGKAQLEPVLGSVIRKTDGKPSLVHESDNRPAVSPNAEAVKEFGDVQVDE